MELNICVKLKYSFIQTKPLPHRNDKMNENFLNALKHSKQLMSSQGKIIIIK